MSKKRPINIGHRGHELGPENTVESFLQAIDCGAEMLELDVWLSGDGVPVVFHDEFLQSADGRRRISQYTAAALEDLVLADGVKIPTLERVLTEVLPIVPLNIELKFFDLNYRPMVRAVVKMIGDCRAEDKVLVSSFFHQSLEIVNRAEPKIATAPIFGVPTGAPHPHDLEKLVALGGWCNEIGLHRPAAVVDYLMLDDETVTAFHRSGLALVAYTVDDPGDMLRIAKLGVRGIITKRPAVLRQVLDAM